MNTKVLDPPRAIGGVSTEAHLPSRDEVYIYVRATLWSYGIGKTFAAVPDLDHMPWEAQLAITTHGNALEPIEQAVADLGFATDGTLAGLVAPLQLKDGDPHYLICDCNEPFYSGSDLSRKLRYLQDEKRELVG